MTTKIVFFFSLKIVLNKYLAICVILFRKPIKSTFARSVNIFTTPNKEIRKVELNQEQHLKIFLMIGLVHYVESEKKTLNRTKDKTKRENY